MWVRATHPGVLNLYFHTAPFYFLVVRLMVKDKAARSAGLSGFNGLRIFTMIYTLHLYSYLAQNRLLSTLLAVQQELQFSRGRKKHQPLKNNYLRYLAWVSGPYIDKKRHSLVLRQQENNRSLEER